ncbi:MAG: peptidoglycan DD-metalloendopeptidase family protein [Rhodocyclaceae bacterium]
MPNLFTILQTSTLLALMLPQVTHAGLPRPSNVPGGVALIALGTLDGPRPQAWLGEQPVLVAADGNRWYAVVGLALDSATGAHELRVNDGGESKVHTFTVRAKRYPEQHVTLKDTSKVQLSPADEERALREIATIQKLKRHWRNTQETDAEFLLPAEGRLAGRFGSRRIFNGEPRSPHSGLDVAVPSGTPIKASASGRVLAVDDYFFNGKTVFVDHGNGLITMYCHLERPEVQAGDPVSKGQRLGLSGKSGRASGPHLHWSVILNGATVDPELFIPARYQKK